MARRSTTASGKAPRGPHIYIGPDLHGLPRGMIFAQPPDKLPNEDECPAVRTLLVPLTQYMEAKRLAEARGTTYNLAVRQVEKYSARRRK